MPFAHLGANENFHKKIVALSHKKYGRFIISTFFFGIIITLYILGLYAIYK